MLHLDAALSPRAVFDQLEPDAQQLVLANASLYGGCWDDLAEDLRRRRSGQPYLFKLAIDVDRALAWIEDLRRYERERGEHISDAVAGV
jgi:hypothetical protein